MGRYGQLGGGQFGIVAPWGLRQYGGIGDDVCGAYQEARITAQRLGLHLPNPPAGCNPVVTTTPAGSPITTAPTTAPHPVDTGAGLVASSTPPPPAAPAWYQSPIVWAAGLAALAWYAWK